MSKTEQKPYITMPRGLVGITAVNEHCHKFDQELYTELLAFLNSLRANEDDERFTAKIAIAANMIRIPGALLVVESPSARKQTVNKIASELSNILTIYKEAQAKAIETKKEVEKRFRKDVSLLSIGCLSLLYLLGFPPATTVILIGTFLLLGVFRVKDAFNCVLSPEYIGYDKFIALKRANDDTRQMIKLYLRFKTIFFEGEEIPTGTNKSQIQVFNYDNLRIQPSLSQGEWARLKILFSQERNHTRAERSRTRDEAHRGGRRRRALRSS